MARAKECDGDPETEMVFFSPTHRPHPTRWSNGIFMDGESMADTEQDARSECKRITMRIVSRVQNRHLPPLTLDLVADFSE